MAESSRAERETAERLASVAARRMHRSHSGRMMVDPLSTEGRILRLSADAVARLERIADEAERRTGIPLTAMQVAALLLEEALPAPPGNTLVEVFAREDERAR